MAVEAVSSVSSGSGQATEGTGSSESTAAAEYRAVSAAKLNSAMESVLVGFMFSQLSDMRSTVSKNSSGMKDRLNDTKELDAESE
jgi:hypothetical protein